MINSAGNADDGNQYNGVMTLREAINLANARPGADTITFAPSMSGQTILLGGSELAITGPTTLDAAPLPKNVTLDAQQLSRAINIDDPSTTSESLIELLAQATEGYTKLHELSDSMAGWIGRLAFVSRWQWKAPVESAKWHALYRLVNEFNEISQFH